MIASKVQSSNFGAAAAELWVLNSGIKEVMVVRSLHFADWSFPESAAAKLNKSKILFRGLGIVITASAK